MTEIQPPTNPKLFVEAIQNEKLTIYDPIEIGNPRLWIPTPELEAILDESLTGKSLQGMKLRTRSKAAKELVCEALGYPKPKSFKKTQPRFPGQLLDTYVQKSNNLQIWNEDLAATRRYAIIRIGADDSILQVKVVTGDTLAKLDTTGTLTQKYQAQCILGEYPSELISPEDTDLLRPFVDARFILTTEHSPAFHPAERELFPIAEIHSRLTPLIGSSFRDSGVYQERNRGAALHRIVCKALGYDSYHDNGQFPDVRHQLLEVKLQTSPTIDLGLVTPGSREPLDVPQLGGQIVRHCDVRYAVFCATTDNKSVELTHFFLTTGQDFFHRFPQFQGRILNKKIQIRLPNDFFER